MKKDNSEVRRKVLEAAIRAVCTDRNAQYGSPEDNFSVIAEMWEPYLYHRCVGAAGDEAEVDISALDVANLMILFKMGRAMTADVPSEDTYVDIAGYAACAAGLARKLREIYDVLDTQHE